MNKLIDVMPTTLVAVKGAGDLATGVIHRLARAGFAVVATELPQPTVVRRTVAFAEAVELGRVTVEALTARRVESIAEVRAVIAAGEIPVVVDADGAMLRQLQPMVLVEATLSKVNSGITMHDAPIVIALGPGYEAGRDVQAVIETNRGHNLGRVYLTGRAEPNTGVPGAIGGYTIERLLRAPCDGIIWGVSEIGDTVQAGETVAIVRADSGDRQAEMDVTTTISGTLRGLLRDGLAVRKGMKVGDVDPRAAREHCFSISDKSRAVGGGVLEAILYFLHERMVRHVENRSIF